MGADDHPICLDCQSLNIRRPKGACGYEARCSLKSKYGRVIDWQYAADSKFAIKELTDKLEVRISPKWCPRKEKKE